MLACCSLQPNIHPTGSQGLRSLPIFIGGPVLIYVHYPPFFSWQTMDGHPQALGPSKYS